MLFDQVSPIGGERADWNTAWIVQNIQASIPRKHPPRGTTGDFVIKWGHKPGSNRQSQDEIKDSLTKFAQMQNARIAGRNGNHRNTSSDLLGSDEPVRSVDEEGAGRE